MSIRDLGVIEITVFVVVLAAFLVFFGLFIMLRHRKTRSNRQRFSKKQLAMEDAMQQKMNRDFGGEHGRTERKRHSTSEKEEYTMFAPPKRENEGRKEAGTVYAAEETLRVWDTNSKAVRTVKKVQKEAGQAAGAFYVEERKISHRRDQLKRMEEAEQRA